MANGTETAAEQEFSQHPFVEEEAGRNVGGILLTIAILTIVGLAIWLIISQEEAA